jgi:ABC-type uncharacterized transport system involved in gliding motility auxiliary subunit
MAKKQQPSWHRFTFIALLVAILACVVGGFFLLTKGLLNVNLFSGATTETLNKGLIISGGVVVLALAVYLLLEPDKVRRAFTGRQARYGSNAFITTLAFLGILLVVNVLIYQNPIEPLDATADKQNTLAPESLQALEQLTEPVTATAFYSANISNQSADELLAKFKAGSDGKFEYTFVNPDLDPVAAKEAGITGDGKILLTMGGRKEIAGYASETEITKAIYRLINPEPRVIYFITGHGEASLESSQVSMATAKKTLEDKNYTVKSLNLVVDNKIPEDALTIVIPGPMKPVSEQEVNLLKSYVDAGGSLIVMENPTIVTDFGDAADPLADYLMKDWGISLNNDIIIDLGSQQPLYAVSASYSQHPITQNLTQNYIVIMPQARSITLDMGLENITTTELLFTSTNSWGEKNFITAEGSQISMDPEDLPGPLVMAASGENSQTKGRVVVFGNSYFADDTGFDTYGNGNIFLNALDWAAFQEDAISITQYESTTRTFVPPSPWQLLVIILGTAQILPGLVILAGVLTWLARRKQG